ncbi:hypothetical protein H4Q26_013984 [Puccinia striiformis f. sp. tritici PST-130]|nr:hypothetical protein H4Q26_013984 [Puccinia striiformis f. sp. tritici PST-130]
MGAHLRNGRNISAEQRQQELDFQSKYPISPAAAERLRRIRAQPTPSTRLREDSYAAGTHRLEHGSIPQGRESIRDIPSSSIERFNSSTSLYRPTGVEPSSIHGPGTSSHPPSIHGSAFNPYPDRVEPTSNTGHEPSSFRESYGEPSEGRRGGSVHPPSELAKTMLDNQWYLFKRARESQNVALMRTALEQAISTQALLTNLIGRDEMLRVSEGWSARVEMDFLETSLRDQNNLTAPTQAVPMVMSTPHLPSTNQQNQGPTIAPNNQAPMHRTLRPTPEITYLGRTHSVTREPLPQPPPPRIQPPSTLQAYQNQPIALRPAMHPQQYVNQAPQPHFEHQQFQPQHHHPYAPRPQPNGRGRGRGWRRVDPTTRMVRMGQSFERVERVIGRMDRIRGQGRGGRNPPYQQYQNQTHRQ